MFQGISIRGKRMAQSYHVAGNLRYRLSMKGPEKQHVPIFRQLPNVFRKLRSKPRIEHRVIFKNQNARHGVLTRLLKQREMASQATICAWRAEPARRDLQIFPVHCRKPNYPVDSVLDESRTDPLPTIRSSVQVYAELMREEVVKLHRRSSSFDRT